MKPSLEILQNPDTVLQIAESEKDIVSGHTKRARSVKDILNHRKDV